MTLYIISPIFSARDDMVRISFYPCSESSVLGAS